MYKNIVANIVSTSNKIEVGFNYNKCKTLEEIDTSLPTLIVGYNLAKNNILNFNILKKSYKEQNIWWTYLKTEKRTDYDKDLMNFNDIIIENIIKKVKYELIDVIQFNKQALFNKLNDINRTDNNVIYNHYNKFLFIYNKNSKYIYGLPLTTCRFCGIDTDEIIKLFNNNKKNTMIYNFNQIMPDIRRKIGNNVHQLVILNEYFC